MSTAVSTTTDSGTTKDCTALASQCATNSSPPINGTGLESDDRQLCTVHPDWCTETGVHDAHNGARHIVMGNDGRELLDARLLDFSGSHPVIGLSETDTDAAEARVKATEFRKFAAELEILADKVDAITGREQPCEPERAVCPDGISFCTGDPADHEDPNEHFHHGPFTAMGTHRPYAGRHGDGIMAFQLSQVNDEAPGLDFVAGGDWPTLSLGEVDELISDMSVHLTKLRAARTQIAGVVSGRTSETAATPGRAWAYDDRYGTRHTVTCPSWCTTDHTDDMDGTRHPADVHHQLYGAVAFAEYTEGYEDYKSWQLLGAHLAMSPDSTASPAYRVPHVLVEVAADLYTRPMDPDQLAEFIEAVAGQLEELRAMHPRLTAARAEWTARTDTTTNAEAA
ncbi:hypothetical protein ACM01_28645 [Streptomyces viridochromogenes]|uniref:Uncharacterized protein n=1 Tax=Streptomyces viridochromogenes TaxID=1938 RepID=A0A0J7Z6J8_STRVR|nr:hypothetical protein [Streptomyces viridochromogenes]KMS71092.1 hypothetical protein ACM01_28645 [Streptomyces viridochromogenes]KOG08379.1 hypothetical protein ADK36_42920 [Streptomyces viridochromogenes]KOG28697.1 hypothetical protein ADK35_03320 [Streptomyces viridochromogenes]